MVNDGLKSTYIFCLSSLKVYSGFSSWIQSHLEIPIQCLQHYTINLNNKKIPNFLLVIVHENSSHSKGVRCVYTMSLTYFNIQDRSLIIKSIFLFHSLNSSLLKDFVLKYEYFNIYYINYYFLIFFKFKSEQMDSLINCQLLIMNVFLVIYLVINLILLFKIVINLI